MNRESSSVTVPSIPDYELIREIGRGSYGDVWLARGVTGLWRAIKIVWRARFTNAEPFEREFRGLKEFAEISLGESTQLALLHVGRNDAAGFFYYVMELADDVERGRSVEPASYSPLTLAALHARRGRIAAEECVKFGVELARALASLHRRGLVHRDIKPSNIILVGGVPKLADIGLVAPSSSARTFIGTEGFVPPEGPGSPAADVFALGKVLYELATGLDRNDFPQLPPAMERLDVVIELNKIILRACDPVTARRYRDGTALLADLESLQAGRPVRRGAGWSPGLAAIIIVVTAGTIIGVKWRTRIAGGEIGAQPPPEPAAAPAMSIAVLPFVNLGTDNDQDYFSDGISDGVLDALARERDLRVSARVSSFSFRGKHATASEIAKSLNVSRLVEGTVQRVGDRVLIRVRLTRARDGTTESLGAFDRSLTDVFALQDEIARAVVANLTHRVASRSLAVLTTNPAAYDAYLRGRAFQTRSASEAAKSIAFYRQAVALDPKFALASVRLAEAIFRPYTAQNDRSAEVATATRTALDRALASQPDLPEALVVRANWHRNVDGDLIAARRDLARAEALQPATAQHRLIQAVLAADAEDWPAAIRLAHEAILLDPQNGDTANMVAVSFLGPRGHFAEADQLLAQAIAIQGLDSSLVPFLNRVFLRLAWQGPEAALQLAERAPDGQRGRTLLRAFMLASLRRMDEARALVDATFADIELQQFPTAATLAEFRVNPHLALLEAVGRDDLVRDWAESGRTSALAAFARGNFAPNRRRELVHAEISLGHRDAALAQLEDWRRETTTRPSAQARISEFNRKAAPLYARLGKADEAIDLLRESIAHGYMVLGYVPGDDLDFAPIRDDPRFKALVQQLHDWAAAQPSPSDGPVVW